MSYIYDEHSSVCTSVRNTCGDLCNGIIGAKLQCNLRKGTAITRPNDLYKKDDGTEASDYQTLTYIKAYYDDGDTGEKLEGPYYCSTKVEYDYGYIESFRSAHKVFKYSMLLGQVELP